MVNSAESQMMSRETRQFFIQKEWKSLFGKINSIPSSRPTFSRYMYP
jgi:hypothetical protein